MSEPSSRAGAAPLELPCQTVIHRAALRKNCMDEDHGGMTSSAFIRRSGIDTDGLSVDIASYRSAAEFAATFHWCRAVASLHVGKVRTLGLDVKPDDPPDPESPSHAVITGVPYKEEDPEEAERIASALARQARIQWREDSRA